MRITAKPIRLLATGMLAALVSACTGLFDGIYDSPDKAPKINANQLSIDASDWHNWYYIDFDSLKMLAEAGDADAFLHARTHFTPYPIPTSKDETQLGNQTGIYTYWFDVFGKVYPITRKETLRPPHDSPNRPHGASPYTATMCEPTAERCSRPTIHR